MQPLRSQVFAYGSEWYEISDEYDDSVTGFSGDYEYFGYLNYTGKWIIQRHQISTGTYRYANGSSGYSTAWSTKDGLSYGYYTAIANAVP